MVTIPMFFAEFSKWKNCRCIFESDVYRCLFFCQHFAVGCHHRRRIFRYPQVSNSALLGSFLLTMCMLALESATNSLSSVFIVDAAFNIHSSSGESNEALSSFFWAERCSWQVSTHLRGRIALVLQSFLEICPHTSKRRDFADEQLWLVFHQATDLEFLGCLLDAMQPSWIVLVELVPTHLCALPGNRCRIWRLSVLWYTTQLSYTFHNNYCTFVITLFSAFCSMALQPSSEGISTLRRIYIPTQTLELTFGRIPTLTRWFSASTVQEVFTRQSIAFLRLASASDVSFSRRTSTSCFWSWWLRVWCGFWCRKLHWSRFEHGLSSHW